MGELVQREDVLGLTFAVDYWDYLGWADNNARPAFSQRQRRYAAMSGTGSVFTPQMIIGGSASVVGSRRGDVEAAIEASLKDDGTPAVAVAGQWVEGDQLTIDVGPAGAPDRADGGRNAATIWLAYIASRVSVQIARGENAGRTIIYHNVVRHLEPVGAYAGSVQRLSVTPKPQAHGSDRIFVVVQSDALGPILGAAAVPKAP